MFFKQFPSKQASLSYFFGCVGHGVAAAVDVVAGDTHWLIKQTKLDGIDRIVTTNTAA